MEWKDIFLPLVTIISSLSGIYIGWKTLADKLKNEFKQDIRAQASLETGIKHIKESVDDIRSTQKEQDHKLDAIIERVAKVEESVKHAHIEISQLEHRYQIAAGSGGYDNGTDQDR